MIVSANNGRLMRIAINSENYRASEFDAKPVNISFVDLPYLGNQFTCSFDKLDKGCWITTPVTYVTFEDGKITFGTNNSVYELISGWGE